jgi:hypothetical protein
MDTVKVLPAVQLPGLEDDHLVASGAELNIVARYTFLP